MGERLSAAASAKEVALKRFRARGDVNDPEVLRRRAKRLEQAQARDVRLTRAKAGSGDARCSRTGSSQCQGDD